MRRRLNWRPRAAARAALAGALLVAGSVPAAAPNAPTAAHTVTIESMRFAPELLVMRVGEQVVWFNKDPFPHTVVSADGALRSPEIAPGRSWRQTLKTRGTLGYACSLHPSMKGELRVR